jgi:hypothetical protein
MIFFYSSLQIIQKDNLKNLKIIFSYVKNYTAKKSVKDHIYIYTTPREMVICDNDGMTGDHI